MRTGSVAFLLGVLLLAQLPELPSGQFFWLLPLLFTLFFTRWLRLFAWFSCGFFWAFFHASGILSADLDKNLQGQNLLIYGKVVSLVEPRDTHLRFEFQVEKLQTPEGEAVDFPTRVQLSWYQRAPSIKPGETWQLLVRLKRPHGFMNPGGFDYERWLFQQQIRARGYIVANDANQRMQAAPWWSINSLRQHLRENIMQNLGEHPFRGLIIALALGDRSEISREQRDSLINTGTSHLLAISGLHIGLVAGLLFFLVRRLWGWSGRMALWLPAPQAAAVAAILAGLMYALLAGFSVPTQRALVMLTVVMAALLTHRRFGFTHVISAALLLVLLFDPLAVLAAGFWLSFSAIAIIAYGMLYRQDTSNLWWRWGRAQYLVAVGLLPLLLLWFQQFPLYGMLANVVAIPWVGFVTVPLALGGSLCSLFSPALSTFVLGLSADSLRLMWPILNAITDLPAANWQSASPGIGSLLLAGIGVAWLLAPRGVPGRYLGIVWLLPALMPAATALQNGAIKLTLLDVGQGLAAVVETREHTLVFDTGAKFSQRFNAGDAVVVPFLREAGIRNIDRLVISHSDNDHIGGATALLAQYPANIILASSDKELLPDHRACHQGQTWEWDDVHFSILHPAMNHNFRGNNASCVLRIEASGKVVLLTGDIEHEAEQALLAEDPAALAANVLVVPHHGSKTSSTVAFIDAVTPEIALIPAGYRNRFNLPNQAILERYASRSIDLYNTANHGAVTVSIDSSGLSLSTYRQHARRFWHHHP